MDTIIEFVKVYNKWANDCHNLVKRERTQLDELAKIDSVARKVLQSIYNKYCTSKNRQYHRAHTGYFFYGGTYNSSSEIAMCTELTKNKVEIQTPKIKNIAPSKKYIVVKQGQVWKIDTVESLAGNNTWTSDIL
ncbi:NTF2 fold immunity protein [Chryseobacterium sp. SIMBA_028]|uniref:NTF2 fold immunity protein n=1 Tax=Chryseobacterium sp. SIMBA_028 TaxID=3085771 RepID=UPI00397C3ECB